MKKKVGVRFFHSLTFCGLAKVAFYTTIVHTKHTLQIYEKLSYEARNRHFCQTAVCALNGKYSSFKFLEAAKE